MTVSIILCSYNRASHLERTLQSLREVVVPDGWTAEVILVDNASTDRTPAVMRAFTHPTMNVRVVREEKPGQCHARNRGVDTAEGEVVLFTDDDVRFPSNWLEGMATPILSRDADAVAGAVKLAADLQRPWLTPLHRALLATTELIADDDPERLVGANMAIARSVFDTIPAFDPELDPGRLGFGGDTLMAWRIKAAGFKIVSAFETVVVHHPSASRVSRSSFRESATRLGASEAYISYHWEHRQWPLWKLYAGLGYYWLRALLTWLAHHVSFSDEEGMTLKELELRRRAARIRKHISLHGTPRKYQDNGVLKLRKVEAHTPSTIGDPRP